MSKCLIISMRPKQWIKNLFIFAALIFSQRLLELHSLFIVFLGFILFSLASSGGYIINDIIDLEKDRHHPIKSKRPIASGSLEKNFALSFAILLIAFSLGGAFLINTNFFVSIIFYLFLSLSYSVWLKKVVIIDIIALSFGFVIRVIAGALIIDVEMSLWLIICTVFLSLFLILAKRRHELVLLEDDASSHREILSEYSPSFIDEMISAITGATIIAYSLYAFSMRERYERYGDFLPITIPFVLYGIFRYLYLVHQKGRGGSPEIDITQDKPLLLNIFIWVISVLLIIYL
ncbi:TPA: decaprenyl-phosphate phosphoribosyltransferase [bacterium]|nr:decaprenyl-phosphate phosphoribosyltransferase [bacterium]